jgi:hypothetical protein
MKWSRFLLMLLIFSGCAYSWAKEAAAAKPRPDQEVRTIIRKKAPFWLQDSEMEIRLNKDGSFSSDRAGGVMTTEGKWRVEKSQLKLVWNSDQREKILPVEIVGRLPVISGANLKSGRYILEASPNKTEN